ncbi:unnamed protein product, partial [Mesorhabditis spiculigera]
MGYAAQTKVAPECPATQLPIAFHEATTTDELAEQIGGLHDIYTLTVVVLMAAVWLVIAPTVLGNAFMAPFEKPANDTFVTVQDEFQLSATFPNPAEWTGSMVFVGNLLFGQFLATVTDYYGRRRIISWSMLVYGIIGVAASFSPSFPFLLMMRLFSGICFTPIFVTNYVHAMECLPFSAHPMASLIFAATWVSGYCLASPIAIIFPHWRLFQLVSSLPCAILGIILILFLPESLGFAISGNRPAEFRRYLSNVSRFSKRHLRYNFSKLVDTEGTGSQEVDLKTLVRETTKKEILQRVVLCSYLWTATCFAYNGLSFESTVLKVGNNHVQFLLSGIAEIPSYFVSPLLFDRIGRRLTVIGICVFFAVTCQGMCILAYFAMDDTWMFLIFWLLAKFGASAGFMCLFIYGSEMFPMSCRSFALGICCSLSNIGAIAAPHAPAFGLLFPGGTYAAFGLLLLLAAVVTSHLPETKDMHK